METHYNKLRISFKTARSSYRTGLGFTQSRSDFGADAGDYIRGLLMLSIGGAISISANLGANIGSDVHPFAAVA